MPGNFPIALYDRILLLLALKRKLHLFETDPYASQEKILLKLTRKSSHTAFGKTYDFPSIRSSRQFLERVSPKSYDDLKGGIDSILKGERDVLLPGRPKCFGITSGTEGASKLVPLTDSLIRSTRRAAIDSALLGGLHHGSMSWHHAKTLVIGPRKGHTLGKWKVYPEGTAFVYNRSSPFRSPFRSRFVPDYRELPGLHEDHDFSLLLRLIGSHGITAIAGNPMEIVGAVLATNTVLPEVEIVFNCGYWAIDHLHIYDAAFPNATLVDVYGSNEGTWGLPVSPGVFLLNYSRVFFSFLPFDGKGESSSLKAADPDRKYRLCVTTPGGIWNYLTGDIVSFQTLRPPLVRLCGREKRTLPLNGDWLTEDEVIGAVRKSGIRSLKYHISPGVKGYVLSIDGKTVDADVLDNNLRKANSTYDRLRDSCDLDPLTVIVNPASTREDGKPARIKSDKT